MKRRAVTYAVEESGLSATWVPSICSVQVTSRGPWHTLELIPWNTALGHSVAPTVMHSVIEFGSTRFPILRSPWAWG